ncbi:MAG: hypothetical protein ABL953_07305 [Ilumatobacteraceae bacterium]
MKHIGVLNGTLFAVSLVGSGCGTGTSTSSASVAPAVSSTSSAPVTMDEFVAAADAACVLTWTKVAALDDPDGVGGQKQLGLGTIVREWAETLAAITAPLDIAADWAEAMELLRLSGVKLEESERLEAAGDPAAGEAQSEALWSLQAEASELIVALDIPFQACSFE